MIERAGILQVCRPCHLSGGWSVCLSLCLSVQWVSCRKTVEWIWMPFGVVSGVVIDIGVLIRGNVSQRKGRFWRFFFTLIWIAFWGVFLNRNVFDSCVNIDNIYGIVINSSFLRCTLLWDRSWHLRDYLLKCNRNFTKKSRLTPCYRETN